MTKEKIQVFGDKVALVELGFDMEGEIFIPDSVQQTGNFRIGKAIAVGDGRGQERFGRHVVDFPGEMYVAVDDALLFQIPRATTLTSAYKLRGHGEASIVVQSDCLARIKPTKTDVVGEVKYIASLKTIEPLGDWALVSMHTEKVDETSIIVRPDSAIDMASIRFTVLMLGTGGDWTKTPVKVADSVIIERMRAIPFMMRTVNPISGLPSIEEYYFIHRDYLLGSFTA